VKWVDALAGKGLSFDGSNDYVRVADSPALDLTSAGTLGTWIYSQGTSSSSGIMHKGESSAYKDEAYSLQFVSSGGSRKVRLTVRDASGKVTTLDSAQTIKTNSWYHIAASWDSSGMKIYINGALSASNNKAVTAASTAGPLFIGSQLSNKNFYKGVIDEAALYDRALSADEIASYYAQTAK
jgi:hypothetical protein